MAQDLLSGISAGEFDKATFDSSIPSLVFFGAARCHVCKELLPTVEETLSHYNGKIKGFWVDVDENKPLFQRFRLKGIPNLLLISQGEVKCKLGGLHTREELLEMIDQFT
ncbi:thioredoxin family protein [Desulfosporosinus sp. PR]|uniref:thioredoxin family protein n=1 Tax=Candidatus Desulfosporosinus nitrosoreducens TaxID=3401928 RepID=UPI0027EF198D|nr:thioredoxin family protein [Desulfosporosinus sp. PR]MDQ7095172.1 thioredoxin family protein [Desulfosporosinus sp. PR]